jgi:hypothetical protein
MSEPSETPRNLVEHAADAGLRAVESYLLHHDAEIVEAFVLVHAKGVPRGEMDTVSAGRGLDEAKDLVSFLAAHFIAAARGVGLRVDLITMDKRGEG